MNWQYLKQTIKENPETAIERFVRDGALVPSNIEESLECVFQVAQLKKLLQERGLKVSGSKRDLVERLVSADHAGMDKIIRKYEVMKCSSMALEIYLEYEKKRQHAVDVAKQQSFDALKNNNPKDAYKIYVSFQRAFFDLGFESNPFKVKELQHILTSQPKILAGITPDNLKLLRAATCMQSLWRDESPETWLPMTFSSGLKNNRVAINYLATHARIKGEVEGYKSYAKRVRIVFYSGDIDSCELCQSLNGKVIDIDKVPELPMPGCTSDTGCKCNIQSVFEETGDDFFGVTISAEENDPLENMRQLKQMLDERLITQDEYNRKKAEILAKL
jgi:hypothetical protein